MAWTRTRARGVAASPSPCAATGAARRRCTGWRWADATPRCAGRLEAGGISVRDARGGSWRVETCFKDFEAAARFADRVREHADVTVRYTARLGAPVTGMKNSLPFMTAASVRPGMAMFTEDGGYDIVESVERVALDRPVYDLNIEGTHNFVAAGLVTHNSIYGFRGADITNILNLRTTTPTPRSSGSSRTTARRRRSSDAANAVIAQQPRADGQVAVDRSRGGRPDQGARARRRARRGAIRRRGGRAARRRGRLARGDRDLLPHERAVAGARGHARARADRLPGHRRHEVLRARRDQGRDRLPDGHRQPAGHRCLHADRQLAAARDRADVARAGDRPTRTRRRAGVGRGGRPEDGARARRPRRARRSSASWARWTAARARCEQQRAGRRPARRDRWPRPATWRRWRPSARSRRRAGSRTSRSSSRSRASTTPRAEEPRSRTSCSRSRWWPTPTAAATTRAS